MILCKPIQYKDLTFKSDTYGVSFEDKGFWFGLYQDENLISVMNAIKIKDGYRLKSNFTLAEHRGKGYFAHLLEWAIKSQFKGCRLEADCLPSSLKIYLRLGFELKQVKEFKSFTIYKVVKNELA